MYCNQQHITLSYPVGDGCNILWRGDCGIFSQLKDVMDSPALQHNIMNAARHAAIIVAK